MSADGTTLPKRLPSAAEHAGLRAVLGTFTTGVTVVTSGRTAPCGMTANSFTSVSLDPPLVLVCVKHGAMVHEAIVRHRHFAVSVLAGPQEQAARYFADRSRPRGADEFAPIGCRPGPKTGAPVLAGALAWLECELAAVYGGGDHSIFLGSVLEASLGARNSALVFQAGRFRRLEAGVT